MTKRIFLSNILTTFLVVVLSSSLLTWVTYQQHVKNEIQEMFQQTQIIGMGLKKVGISFLTDCKASVRLTWIDKQGAVLFDSLEDAETMDSHLYRSEVVEALHHGSGSSIRKSDTLLTEQIYVALALEDGSILRASKEQNNLLSFFLSILQPLIFVLLFGGILSFFIASSFTNSIMKPLSQLDLDNPMKNPRAYEEITPLLRKIQKQYQKINQQLLKMSQKQEEFDIITRNMGEGLLLLDPEGHILSLNDTASKLFQTNREESIGKNILTLHRSVELQEILEKAYGGTAIEGTIPLEHQQIYQVNASPILQEGSVSGLALLFVNSTEKTQSEKLRREFSANVSHELKTPLHSISGCAELLSHNFVAEKDIPVFASQIYNEAQRLIRMVEEIISLSRLDEGMENLMVDRVDLYSLGKEVCQTLADMAKEQEITLVLQGESATMRGNYHLLSATIRNLCENAIKYNRPHGQVELILENKENTINLRVNDSGIGLSEQDKPLIFQRFYRVDKSRSKEIGGTGLGLSIVKHAVTLHKGHLTMESALGIGTSISIEFPKEQV